MKTRTIVLMVALGLLVLPAAAVAGNSELEHYYNDYITEKIYNCARTASIFDACCNVRMTECEAMRAAQAVFYQQNRAKLVKAMRTIPVMAYKADHRWAILV